MNRQEFLGTIDIFSSLNQQELTVLAASVHERKVSSGKILFREGDEGKELFIVQTGRLGISVSLADGRETEIAEFGPKEFFGEMSIFQGEPRSATCRMKEAGVLLSLGSRDFFSLIDEHPAMSIRIMHRMLNVTTGRLKRTNRFLTGMVRWGEEASRRAVSDEFTGLFNRGFFDTSLERRVSEARSEGIPLSLAMSDLDGFGKLNVHFGESFCNQLILKAVAGFKSVFAEGDILTRYGGDEFAFILPGRQPHEAAALCQRVCEEIRTISLQVEGSDAPVGITSSIGIATMPHHAFDGKTLLKRADEALYSAKEAGRDRVFLYDGGEG